ncbi:MAG: hypothetical protein KDC00_13390 [Flavobacteriales bacterium]|nr:hypothetical protein [Flavobacteriales bacterium]
MRVLLIYGLCLPLLVRSQPSPPSFCIVLAHDREALRPLEREVNVVQLYRERVPYVGINGSWSKPEEVTPLQGGPLFRDSTERWTVYHPLEGMAESHLLITAGTDTMRIDLPEDPSQLIDRAWSRGQRDTPEVIRFRKGRYAIEDLIQAPWAISAARKLAGRLIAEDEAAYKKELAALEEYYRNQAPPAAPAPPYTPPPPMTEQDWADHWAQQPPLKEVLVERTSADTVWQRITGRVMLNGGCGSGMPIIGIEMLSDTGWVERIPFDPTQMDCGLPWADWEDHRITLPLRWWLYNYRRVDDGFFIPGNYRIVLMGGNMKEVRSPSFHLL